MNFWHATWIWWKSDLQKSSGWGLKRIQIDTKCLNNQNDTDYLGKGPCIGQSVPEAVLGLQNTEFSQQCTSQARATKIAILIISFGNPRIPGFCNDLLLWRRSTCPDSVRLWICEDTVFCAKKIAKGAQNGCDIMNQRAQASTRARKRHQYLAGQGTWMHFGSGFGVQHMLWSTDLPFQSMFSMFFMLFRRASHCFQISHRDFCLCIVFAVAIYIYMYIYIYRDIL